MLRELRDAVSRSGGRAVAVATVVGTSGSAPRLPGSAMLVTPGGEVVGSVSGGCVEATVYELAREALTTGRPGLHRFGVSDDDAFTVGLTCGGEVEVFVERVPAQTAAATLDVLLTEKAAGRPVAVATVIAHPDPRLLGARVTVRDDGIVLQGPTTSRLARAIAADAAGLLASGTTGCLRLGPHGERIGELPVRVFVQSFAPPPRLVLFGAVEFSAALAKAGRFLGYRVTLCDARPIFATQRRFPAAHEVVVDWPHRYLASEQAAGHLDARTAICVLTHDPKFDVPALTTALALPQVGYVGAMGSRRTHEQRLARLREAGVTDAQLARLRSPLGLDLGATTPEGTAVSIMAEILALRGQGSGRPLSDTTGAIHPAAPAAPADQADQADRSTWTASSSSTMASNLRRSVSVREAILSSR